MEFDINKDSVITRDEILQLTPDEMRRAKHSFKLLTEPIVTAPFYSDEHATYKEFKTFIDNVFIQADTNKDGTITDSEQDVFLSTLNQEQRSNK